MTAAACGVLPDDHALPDALGRGSRRAVDSLTGTVREVADAGRRIDRLTSDLGELPDDLVREVGRLQGAGAVLAGSSADRLQRLPSRTVDTLDTALGDSVQRIRALVAAPERLGIDPEQQLGDLWRSLEAAPRALRLDGRPLVAPTDPERSIEIVPSGRRWTLLERVLDRMAF
jgi:hypothetical protein